MVKILVSVICLFALFQLSLARVVGKDDYDWWEFGHFYQIYPRSFQDSDGNGVGDIQGIISRLPHLKSIGVTGVWLSPIFKSPMKDFGYDISDFREIDPIFGTMADFEQLAAKSKELDIKLILDFVPNHSSDQHEWFKASSDPNHPNHEKYKDFYTWNKGKVLENGTRAPPSNWNQMFRGSAWTWVEGRQAYYLHQFLDEQPDLNYRHEGVADEMKEILRFWLRKGVSGFRCDAVPFLFEVKENEQGYYDDEPLSGECQDDPQSMCYLKHIHTQDKDETYDMIYQWRKVMDEDEFSDYSRILMTEAYTNLTNLMRYYGRVENGEMKEYGSQMPFNFDMIEVNQWTKAGEYKDHVSNWMTEMPKGKGLHPNWVLGNHDKKRFTSRLGVARTDIYNILLKTLPGITVTYYGEELGMTDQFLTWEETVDPQACRTNPNDYDNVSRDPARTPMQWNADKNAGFSTADKTWLPVAKNYTESNVELQESQEKSYLKNFKKLIELRENMTMKRGSLYIKALDDDVLVYIRSIYGRSLTDAYAIALNFGSTNKVVDMKKAFGSLNKEMKVVVASIHSTGPVAGDIVNSHEITLPPHVGLVMFSEGP